jgi:hypothetical protein
MFLQKVQLSFRLDAFSDNCDLQALAYADDGLRDHRGIMVGWKILDERAIYLKLANAEPF